MNVQPVAGASDSPAASAPSGAAARSALLQVDDLTVRFGGIVALNGVSFDVRAGEVFGLIGPNGAGKTTLFNCLSRLYDCNAGKITFDGRDLLATPRHRIAQLGIGRTFQNLALFRSMSVEANVLVGMHARERTGFAANLLQLGSVRAEATASRARARELLAFLSLEDVAATAVSALPFGTLKRVELARALASSPRLLLLDEPAAGLNHDEVQALRRLILDIRERFGSAVLLVEHHMNLVMSVSERVLALDFGRRIALGTAAEVRDHPEVIRAYLGSAQ